MESDKKAAPAENRPSPGQASEAKSASKPAAFESRTPAAPVPSLPKGGGAIRSVGETFKANPATGSGSLSIPLPVSPGRGGFQPSLSLAYDSGAGNGPFGAGFSLGVPHIARKTDKGLPTYDDKNEADVFVLSGAEDLVPTLDANGAIAEFTVDDGVARRYRPRVEGLFAVIERRTTTTGDVYWRVVTKDNIVSIYGKSSDARIANPRYPKLVFSWLLEETQDDRGNVVRYKYKAEDLSNVDRTKAAEAHRIAGLSDITANRYLKRVFHGNFAPNPTTDPALEPDAFAFELVFDYGEHDLAAPVPEDVNPATWTVREDPFSSYRSTFEIRTYRLCRRVLSFHRFAELSHSPALVASLDFEYDGSPVLNKLIGITRAGYLWNDATSTYDKLTYPKLELAYNEVVYQTTSKPIDKSSLAPLRSGIDGSRASFIDLDGEGLPGVLIASPEAFYYKQNLGGAVFSPPKRLPTRPVLAQGTQQLMDIDGDGRKELVEFRPPVAGYHDRLDGDAWAPFHSFRSIPTISPRDPNARFVDLTGDGLEDFVWATGDAITWFRSLGKKGFAAPIRIRGLNDENKGPKFIFADGTQSIFLADMSGDGLLDIVRVRNGSLCYWPNKGYGRFGAKVTMAFGQMLDRPDRFDPRRVRLADVDGSGTTDIVYLRPDGIYLHANQAGNRFAAPFVLPPFRGVHDLVHITVIDLLGTGTACVVWSSPMPGDETMPVRYVDLLNSTKPHLLKSIKNNVGLETRLAYAPSTKFYRQDAGTEHPWATKLPFPVQVLERVEVYDDVAKRRFVSTYSYHHGHYDGVEREFRGFGRVEQWDAESFSASRGDGLFPALPDPLDPELHVPPVHTKTWFHTGAWTGAAKLEATFRTEYFNDNGNAPFLPDTTLPNDLTAAEMREAARALKGSILRQEVYADDGTDLALVPYATSERSYTIALPIQGAKDGRHGVFFVHPSESIDIHYERKTDDPRVTHSFTLAVDDYGFVTRSAAVAYGRRGGPWPSAQQDFVVTVSETSFFHQPDITFGWYRLGVPLEEATYELKGLTAPSGADVFSFTAVRDAAATTNVLAYDEAFTTGNQKRLLRQTRHTYWKDDLSSQIAFGSTPSVESMALPHASYTKAFRPALLTSVFNTLVTNAILTEGGYVQFTGDDAWWIPSGHQVFDSSAFYLPTSFVDALGATTTVAYDSYFLLVNSVTDALGNVVSASNDYRVLQPVQITDPNGNRAAVKFDALGVVIATAVMGKDGSTDGDTLDDPTTTFDYDLTAYTTNGKPVMVHSAAREQHGDPNTRWRDTYLYFDGAGHPLLTKARAEAGDAPLRDANGDLVKDANGNLVLGACDPRWVGTGRTVLDNKGNPVKQYEPFFSSTHEYEDEADLVEWGVTPILHYDPLGRLIKTELPNGTTSTVTFDAWSETHADPNDNVYDPDEPNNQDLWSLWYAQRHVLASGTPDRRAADLTEAHAKTPQTVHLDVLGRPYRVIQDNKTETIETTTTFDIEGNPLVVTDARLVAAMTQVFGMSGISLTQVSLDAGTRWTLPNVLGLPLRRWDSRDQTLRYGYDDLRRPTHIYCTRGAASETLVQRSFYGEIHPSAAAQNLLGKLYQVYDGAGVLTTDTYDFKGNLLTSSRRVATDYTTEPDWSALASLTTVADIDTAATPLLSSESFDSSRAYDAMNRVTSMTLPDASEIKPTYNEASLLEAVDVRVRGAASWTSFVGNIDYNAKGQRELIEYGNGTSTDYAYDPLTFRLTRLLTTRASDSKKLQDLNYTYDPVGNIVALSDAAQQDVYFSNTVISPDATYEYDAIYRLMQATGREQAVGADNQRDQNGVPLQPLRDPNDIQAVRNYTEQYQYDKVGNILAMIHLANGNPGATGSWTRYYAYETEANETTPKSNRLVGTSLPGDAAGQYSATYTHDAHGNMTSMPHLTSVDWTWRDEMRQADISGAGTAYYTYDASGERVRKVWEHNGLVEERIYLGGYEVYRRTVSGTLELERQTLHVMDDKQRIAMVETKTIDTNAPPFTPTPRYRFQLGNHLGSVAVEVDGAGNVFSYEEYHPYGTTAYHSSDSAVEVSAKRYRYTGKERDEETGLYYHGARYYACWLGRWAAADPAGMADSVSLFVYVRGNPVSARDPNGADALDVVEDVAKGAALGVYDVARGAKRMVGDTGEVILDVAGAAADAYNAYAGEEHLGRLAPVVGVVAGVAAVLPTGAATTQLLNAVDKGDVKGGARAGVALLLNTLPLLRVRAGSSGAAAAEGGEPITGARVRESSANSVAPERAASPTPARPESEPPGSRTKANEADVADSRARTNGPKDDAPASGEKTKARAKRPPVEPSKLKAPAARHALGRVRIQTLPRAKNSVIASDLLRQDVAMIVEGKAEYVRGEFRVNGRAYGQHGGTLFPISGPGIFELNRGAFKALGVYNELGLTAEAEARLNNAGISSAEREAALMAWRAGKPE